MRRISSLLLAGAAAFVMTPAALAADLLITPPPGVVYDPAPVSGWDGFYIGAHGGLGSGFADHNSISPGNDLSLSGFLVGVQAGANFYITDGIIGGIEADASWANIAGSGTFGPSDITQSIDWTASLRGKLGFDGGQFMPYLTAGLAVAQGTRDVTTNGTPAVSNLHTGWTAGAGVDMLVTDDVSLNLEYRYSDYGSAVYDTGGTPPTIGLTSHAVRAGFNFHF